MSKRDRATNWDKDEKHLLLEILKKYLPVIENKNLSTNTSKEKCRAWNEVLEKFNLMNGVQRDMKQLKNQWKISKLKSKKEISICRKEITKTGGGPKPPSPSLEAIEIFDMLPQEFEVDQNEFDSDGIMYIPNAAVPAEAEEISMDQPNCEIKNKNDIFDGAMGASCSYRSNPPKKPVKKTKGVHQSFNFSEATFNDMHQFRCKENERLQEEHEQRRANMAEIHAQTMKILLLQQEIYLKTLEKLNKEE